MKSAVYLDAYVLACPSIIDKELSVFHAYVENLIAWTELKHADWIKVYISKNASYSLAESNAYPPHDALRQAIEILGVTHIQVQDIVSLINGFLLKSQIIEDELGIDELLFDDYNIELSINLQIRQAPFPYHFQLLTVLLSLHNHFISDVNNQVLITSQDCEHIGLSWIRASVTDLLTTSSKVIPDDIHQPLPVSVQFYVCRCLHSLHASLDPCNIWANAGCEYALKKAIELFLYQSQHRQGPYISPVSHNSFSIGSHFVQSCMEIGFFSDTGKIRILLRSCSETILGTNCRATHWIRTSRGGNSPQLKRGDDNAWRRDIDHAYHLHYWSTPNGPELANVVKHDDLTIF